MPQRGTHELVSIHFTPRPLVRSKFLNIGHSQTLLSIDFSQTESKILELLMHLIIIFLMSPQTVFLCFSLSTLSYFVHNKVLS